MNTILKNASLNNKIFVFCMFLDFLKGRNITVCSFPHWHSVSLVTQWAFKRTLFKEFSVEDEQQIFWWAIKELTRISLTYKCQPEQVLNMITSTFHSYLFTLKIASAAFAVSNTQMLFHFFLHSLSTWHIPMPLRS